MRRTCAFIVAVFALALSVHAQELRSRRTQYLNLVYYDKAHEYLSYHLARAFENSLGFHRKLFDYTPSQPVVILMQDFSDYGHGGTSTVPWNFVSVGIEPFDYVYDTMPANERMNWLMHHELVHVVATDQAADRDLTWRKLFHGKVAPVQENPISMFYSFLTSPRWYSPRWYHEGIAVFMETWMAGGTGRVLGGFDEMVFRTMALENAYFYDVVGLESEGTTIDFQVGQNSYLYGTRFVTHLAVKYGPEKVIEWFSRTSGSERYFSAQFRKVFGVPLDEEWARWIASEHEWQKKNLELIRQYGVTKQTPVTPEALGSLSRTYYDPEKALLYAAVNRPAKPAQIVSIALDGGRITPLADIKAPALYFVTSLAFDPKARKLFFTSDNTSGWRDLNELDLGSGRQRILLKDCRTGDLVVNRADQSIWGVQHHNGLSSVVVIPKPYTGWKSVLTLDYGKDIFDLDISPDGRTLSASMIDISGRQQLISASIDGLLAGGSNVEVLHEFENNSPANFVFSRDGRYLYGTSYYTGVSNVFRYDFASKKMAALTNVETGLFRPLPISDAKMVAYDYTSKGFVPVTVRIEPREDVNAINYLGQQVAEKHPIVKSWNAGSPARVNLDQVTTYAGAYRPLSELRLGSIYPVVEGYKDTVAAGVRINLSDPLALHVFDITAAVSPQSGMPGSERLHLNAGYEHAPWRVRARYNGTDFYDLFGPTKTSLKGYSLSASRHQFLIYDRPRLMEYTISGAYYGGLDTVPDYQNVRAPFTRYVQAGASLDFHDLRRTIGAVDNERGYEWTLAANGNYVNATFFPRLYATYDRGVLLPLDHTSLWLRTSAGKSWGERTNPFANFFFGAFGNNWVDHRDTRRYREYSAFPGTRLEEIGGNDFGRAMVELTLPPLRFKRLGVPGLYTNWSRLALFSSVLTTDIGRKDVRETHRDVGAQVDFSIVAFSNLDAVFSIGEGLAFHNGQHSHETMVSLKLLR